MCAEARRFERCVGEGEELRLQDLGQSDPEGFGSHAKSRRLPSIYKGLSAGLPVAAAIEFRSVPNGSQNDIEEVEIEADRCGGWLKL